MKYLLALDQGTTNSRAILFSRQGEIVGKHEMALRQHFPQPGWVEQDPEEMYANIIACCRMAVKNAKIAAHEIAAIGITNQRETIVLWDKQSGRALHPAIVWQDRRTGEICARLRDANLEEMITAKTGLLLDPYFSATKILWLFENFESIKTRAQKGEILAGTVDSYLLWRLTGGKMHATDITNASRTMLFNLETQDWDETLLSTFEIPRSILPKILDNIDDFGNLHATILGAPIPIRGMAGDQQAATIGQTCFEPGLTKATFGTGGFLLMNTGDKIIHPKSRLLATIAYRFKEHMAFGLEGSIFSAGETVKWLRDTMGLIQSAAETEFLAASATHHHGVYLVPAFTGLGAPYWKPFARAEISGITRTTGRAEIVRAALESVAYQTRDLLEAMQQDANVSCSHLRVDGGMAANHWFLQFLADMLDIVVERPTCIETTALGAAYLAGLGIGCYTSIEEIEANWRISASYMPTMKSSERSTRYDGWAETIQHLLKK